MTDVHNNNSEPSKKTKTKTTYIILNLFCLRRQKGTFYISKTFYKKNSYEINFGTQKDKIQLFTKLTDEEIVHHLLITSQ